MTSRFFIERPVFAAVLSIVIVLAGLMALRILPIAQYPEIAPPTVTITATYPGASAETLATTVAAPIEEQLSGVENLLYFQSSSSSNGQTTITATFEVGTDVDKATFNVNNRVQLATPRLPDEVRRNGVVVAKRSMNFLLVVALNSPKGTYDSLFLSNYATQNVLDELKRVPGAGDVQIFGARDYSMRLWLQPDKMARLGVTTGDIAAAVNAQNAQFAAGKIGADPAPKGQQLVYTVTARGRLIEPEQFGDIIVRSGSTGSGAGAGVGVLRLKDVARIELGAQSYDATNSVNGQPAIALAVFLASGANALDAGAAIKQRIAELKKERFPADIDYLIPYDTTRFVSASISEVVTTVVEAALIVLLVVFVFLQTWRATLIPMLAVPVSLIGTFAGLWLAGFSINTLTLFAMVLAIGIVVDDAIVVLENVERLMREEKMAPMPAAIEAMREVSGAVVGIVLVLAAVFIPVAFLGGIAGTLYRQFAVTVTIAVVISGIVALTLTAGAVRAAAQARARRLERTLLPALQPLLRLADRPLHARRRPRAASPGDLGAGLPRADGRGGVAVRARARQLRAGGGPGLHHRGRGVARRRDARTHRKEHRADPPHDEGQPRGGELLHRQRLRPHRRWYQAQLGDDVPADEAVGPAQAELAGAGRRVQRQGLRARRRHRLRVQPAAHPGPRPGGWLRVLRAGAALQRHGGAGAGDERLRQCTARAARARRPHDLLPPDGAAAARGGRPREGAGAGRQHHRCLRRAAGADGFAVRQRLQQVRPHVPRHDAGRRGIPQQAGGHRRHPRAQRHERPDGATEGDDPRQHAHRPGADRALQQLRRGQGDRRHQAGLQLGEGIAAVEAVARQALPPGYSIEWTAQAYQEKRTGSASVFAFGFALIMVYLILSALYERWGVPLAVVLAVPFAVTGALLAVFLREMSNDIYFQIGLVVLIGLAAKNAILIAEFAMQGMEAGKSAMEAAQEAARLRFRPILMTSLAFVMGVVPLVLATGAGAAARQSMGTGVFGGMIVATFVAPLFVPLFFSLLARKPRPAHGHHGGDE